VTFEAGSRRRKIGEDAFQRSGLKNIVIPASVGVIGAGVFQKFEPLTSVIFEAGSVLEEIGMDAFVGIGLKSIVIPASVRVIEKCAFFSAS
jgi:hypothetical protein